MKRAHVGLSVLLLSFPGCACVPRAPESLLAVGSSPKRGRPLERQGAPLRNVVLIVMDDVGSTEQALLPSLFGAGGFAAQGMTFTQAYAWPVCSPTRVAMMTGRYPRREGIGDVSMAAMQAGNDELRLSLNTMGEAFAPAWATAYFGKWHLGRAPIDTGEGMGLSATDLARVQAPLGPLAAGFEEDGAIVPDVPNSGAQGFYQWWRGEGWRLAVDSTTYANDAVETSYLSWWASEPAPRMAWLSFPCAHGTGVGYEIPPGGTDQPTIRGDYEECVRYLDGALSRVLAAIDLETTFVVVTSDNGTPDNARPSGTPTGFWKGTTFQGGVHVPLIVAGPGITQGGTSDRVVSLVDLPATVIELAGAIALPGMDDSMSFANELGTWVGTSPRAFTFTERYSAGYDDQAVIEDETTWPGTSIVVRLKLRRVDPDGAFSLPSEDLLYDLMADPFELAPVSLSSPIVPPTVRARLLAELGSIPARQ